MVVNPKTSDPTSALPAGDPGALGALNPNAPEGLSRGSFWLALGASVGLFLYFNPFWLAVEIGDLDRGILWSYGLLPVLTWGLLLAERKLRFAAWFLETLKLVLIKFTLTYALASVGWVLVSPPLAADHDRVSYGLGQPKQSFAPRPAPAATRLEPERCGDLSGRLLDQDGNGLQGVLVSVSAGLEGQRFLVPERPLGLSIGPEGWSLDFGVLRAFQELVLVSDDDRLHTIQISTQGGGSVLNHPCTPGSERSLMFDHAMGLLDVHCRVHGATEGSAQLLVSDHPFQSVSDAAGFFSLRGLPEGELVLWCWRGDLGSSEVSATVRAGELSIVDPWQLAKPAQ